MAGQGGQLAEPRTTRAVEVVVRQLVNTRKFIQLYPLDNARVQRSLDELFSSLQRLIHGIRMRSLTSELMLPVEIEELTEPVVPAGLVVGVGKAELRRDDEALCESDALVKRFAMDLYRHDVQAFHLAPEISRSDLEAFLVVAARSPAEVRLKGGFDEVLAGAGVNGIEVMMRESVEVIDQPIEDMIDYFEAERANRMSGDPMDSGMSRLEEEDADIRDITDFFADIFAGSPDKMSYMMETLLDPARLVTALEHLHEADCAASTREDGPSYAVMRHSLGQLAESMKQFPPVMREEFLQNVAQAIVGAGEDTRRSIINEALPDLVEEDFALSVLAELPDAEVADTLLQAVRFRNGTVELVTKFLDDQVHTPERRASIIRHMLQRSSEDSTEQMGVVLDILRKKLAGAESQDDPGIESISDTESLHRRRMRLNDEVRVRAAERESIAAKVETELIERTDEHAARALAQLYITPTIEGVSKPARDRLTTLISSALDRGAYSFLAELIHLAETDLAETSRLRVLDALEPALAECRYPQHLNRILSRMRVAGRHSEVFAQMAQLLEFLGDPVIEHLFIRLEMEPTRSMRMFFLDLFDVFGQRALPLLRRKSRHRDWFVVRNVAFILGGIHSDPALDLLDELLTHRDMRVRREAVRSIARMGSERSRSILTRELDSPDPMMGRLAAEWIGRCGVAHALPELRRRIESTRDGTRLHPDVLIGLVRGLGMIGEPDDARIIRRSIPRLSWLGGEKKRALSQAGRKAIDDLEIRHEL